MIANPTIDIGDDTISICNGSDYVLDLGPGHQAYYWTSRLNHVDYYYFDQTLTVNEIGTHYGYVRGNNGCNSPVDTVFIDVLNVDILQNDTTICEGDSVFIFVDTANLSVFSDVLVDYDFENSYSGNPNAIIYNYNTMSLNLPEYQTIGGEFGHNNSFNIDLLNLNEGDSLTLEFDLLLFGSWDGNSINGPDKFKIQANFATLLDASFSNIDASFSNWNISETQSYPSDYGFGNNAATNGAKYFSENFDASNCDNGTGICTGTQGLSDCGGGGLSIYRISKNIY